MKSSDCQRCHGVGYVLDRKGEHAHAEICACNADCPICKNSRYIFAMSGGYEVAQPCSCVDLHHRIRLFNEAEIPAGYAGKTLSGFVHSTQEPGLGKAKQWFARYQRSPDGGRGVVLIGPPGVGKTHLVCAFLGYMTLHRGVSCRFVDFHALTARIRATFDGHGGQTEASLINPLVNAEVLVIDDLGKGKGTNWELTIVDQLVSRRYNANRVVVATTNYRPESDLGDSMVPRGARAARLRESLEERIGSRIYSRLCEMCDLIRMSGRDRRQDASPQGHSGGGQRNARFPRSR